MEQVNITIIGAGVIGLAIAAELSAVYEDVVVLEKHPSYGQETSSRNSEVIHSGIYYPYGSMKAEMCRKGADLLYNFCEKNNILFRRTGKYIVAGEEKEITGLKKLMDNGKENGVSDLQYLSRSEIRRIEPVVKGCAALFSSCTGIVDSHGLMKKLYQKAGSQGTIFAFGSKVTGLERKKEGFDVFIEEDDYSIRSRVLINAAGLASDKIAESAGINIDAARYRLKYCKGSYFGYSGVSPVKSLVYPVPENDLKGLGVHATLNLGGSLRFGPDAEDVEDIEYTVNGTKKDSFYECASRIISGLDKDAFHPDMSGIRPKLTGPGIKDFIISNEQDKGLPGLINLIGIESPGLTSSLAIAGKVKEMVSTFLN